MRNQHAQAKQNKLVTSAEGSTATITSTYYTLRCFIHIDFCHRDILTSVARHICTLNDAERQTTHSHIKKHLK